MVHLQIHRSLAPCVLQRGTNILLLYLLLFFFRITRSLLPFRSFSLFLDMSSMLESISGLVLFAFTFWWFLLVWELHIYYKPNLFQTVGAVFNADKLCCFIGFFIVLRISFTTSRILLLSCYWSFMFCYFGLSCFVVSIFHGV